MFSQKQLSLWLLSGASCKVPLHLLQPWAGTIPSCMCWHTVDGIHAALVGRSECWASERTQVVGLHPLQLWKPKSPQNATHFVELLFFYLLRENYKLKSKRIDNYKHNNAQLFTVHLITRKLTFNHLKYQFPVVYSLFLSLLLVPGLLQWIWNSSLNVLLERGSCMLVKMGKNSTQWVLTISQNCP